MQRNKIETKIKDVESKINNIKHRIKESDNCFICYESIDNKTIMNCCSNSACFKCIHTWVIKHPTCPLCKAVVKKENLFVVKKEDETIIDYSNIIHKSNEKFTNLVNIINSLDPENKILLFSAYDNTFIKIVNLLDEHKIAYNFLKGNQNTINKVLGDFKNGDVKILLINPLYYGSGLNLEMTTDIIMFHKFDSEIEKQVIGRAQRNGRKERLNLWYLMHENELSNVDKGTM